MEGVSDVGTREDWRKLASDLGFEFKEGLTALTESKTLMIMLSEQMHASLEHVHKLLETPVFRLLMEKTFMGAIVGEHRGYEIVIHQSAETQRKHTLHYVGTGLFFKHNLDWGLDIQKAWFVMPLGRWLFPGGYVRLPGSDLDKRLAIKAKKTDQARVFLADGRVQQTVGKLFDLSDQFRITDHGIRHKEPGKTTDRTRVLYFLDAMADAAAECGL